MIKIDFNFAAKIIKFLKSKNNSKKIAEKIHY